ncbi:uncharacterized protein LOC131011944 [Salvia miltiorrhiza]|uniref:uncharacterized protein LOC131011944 n=1 Tax=Salvia miltiorrhiza TaxID=226208 RepID=UPI0025AD3C3E|nr:uncharacterized protein LOC131011944 [Salvia miltiorrhiza]
MTAISKCYHKELYAKAYCHVIHPVPGVKFWNVRAEDEVEPPPVEIKVGRPKKNRVRAKHEPRHQHKLSGKGSYNIVACVEVTVTRKMLVQRILPRLTRAHKLLAHLSQRKELHQELDSMLTWRLENKHYVLEDHSQ